VTTDTGDLQRFVLSADNFDPEVIAAMARMETEPIQGYRLAHVRTGESWLEFAVVSDADGVWLSHNVVHLDHWPPSLELETTILRPIPRAEAAILADLERCAAIAHSGIETRDWYSQSPCRGKTMRVIYLVLITALALRALLLAAGAALRA